MDDRLEVLKGRVRQALVRESPSASRASALVRLASM